ncbi:MULTISPECIES: hypothetical protein [Paenibacillus]|nr:hypothetical protein [Paenibacillus odorifer]
MNELLNQAGMRQADRASATSQLTNKKAEQRYSNKGGTAALLP